MASCVSVSIAFFSNEVPLQLLFTILQYPFILMDVFLFVWWLLNMCALSSSTLLLTFIKFLFFGFGWLAPQNMLSSLSLSICLALLMSSHKNIHTERQTNRVPASKNIITSLEISDSTNRPIFFHHRLMESRRISYFPLFPPYSILLFSSQSVTLFSYGGIPVTKVALVRHNHGICQYTYLFCSEKQEEEIEE